MLTYTNLTSLNVAPKEAKFIGAFNEAGELIGKIAIPESLSAPTGTPLYKVGIFSDAHLWDRDDEGTHGNYQIGAETDEGANKKYDSTAFADLEAYRVFSEEEENVDFHCFCGDMTSGYKDSNGGAGNSGTTKVSYGGDGNTWNKDDEALMWMVKAESFSKPMYTTNGNHDCYGSLTGSTYAACNTAFNNWFNHEMCHYHTQGDDVYIFLGMSKNSKNGDCMFNDELQWLYETLEANRNKRCFIFFHAGASWCTGGYGKDTSSFMLTGTQADVFASLLEHYKNCLFFHGHTHMMYEMQTKEQPTVQRVKNAWDIHISSLSQPRNYPNGTRTVYFHKSQAYIAEIYDNGVLLKGREMDSINAYTEDKKPAYLPIAQFWLPTEIQTVEKGTYTDPTGTITV